MITTSCKNGIETEKHSSGLEVVRTVNDLVRMKDSCQREIDDLTNDLDSINSRINKTNASLIEP